MQFYFETKRLILRDMLMTDADDLYILDSNPEVHRYLGNDPVKDMTKIYEVIPMIQKQYQDNGIGRWATLEKSSGRFIGWAGLKLVKEDMNGHCDFYDVGYRFMPEFWGKGYATEAAVFARDYAFHELQVKDLYGIAHVDNKASRRVLEKTGLHFVESFIHDDILCDWLVMHND